MSVAAGPRVVEVARGWIGTPYCHQASAQNAGADCLGLVRGVWRSLYGPEPQDLPAYTPDWGEPSHTEVIWQACETHLRLRKPGEAPEVGDLLLFRLRPGLVAKHLGIAAASPDGPTFLHAMSGHGVVESPLSAPWARRVAARFVFPPIPSTDKD
ncbi:MAG: NlpC/P60 family protein [Pseudomonadota bacterium]